MPASEDKSPESYFRFFSPTFKFPDSLKLPGSGSFGSFNFQPNTKWESPALFRGDELVESRIYSEIASPGKQLGKISELVLQLADTVTRLENKVSLLEQELGRSTETHAELKPAGNKTLDMVTLEQLETMVNDVEEVKTSNKNRVEKLVRQDLTKLAKADKDLCKAVIQEYLQELEKQITAEKQAPKERRKKKQSEEV
jgi:hypothetical protein